MDFGFIAALILAGLLIYLLTRGRRRSARLFSQAGFEAVALEGSELVRVAEAMTGLPAVEIHSGEHRGREISVVELDSGSSDDPNLTLILYELADQDYPMAAAFQTSQHLPRLLRRVTGGFFAQLQPLERSGETELGKGWSLFSGTGTLPDKGFAARLSQTTRISEAPFLLAIGLSGRYLGLWGSRFFLRHLLVAGPKVVQIMTDDNPRPTRMDRSL